MGVADAPASSEGRRSRIGVDGRGLVSAGLAATRHVLVPSAVGVLLWKSGTLSLSTNSYMCDSPESWHTTTSVES